MYAELADQKLIDQSSYDDRVNISQYLFWIQTLINIIINYKT